MRDLECELKSSVTGQSLFHPTESYLGHWQEPPQPSLDLFPLMTTCFGTGEILCKQKVEMYAPTSPGSQGVSFNSKNSGDWKER